MLSVMNMAHLKTPVGMVCLTEEASQITTLSWSNHDRGFRSQVLKDGLNQLEAYFARTLTQFDLPLAPAGTKFQKQVYEIMCEIPFGHTLTYGDVAQKLNASPQAVGQACGSNPIPIFIPCHRIVGTGGLGGYSGSGGVETKVWLLRHEGANSQLL